MNIYRNTFFHWLETIEAFDEGDYANRLKRREEKWVHKKFSWNDHEYQLIHENQFENEYRMSYEAFHRLKEMMWVLLKRKRKIRGFIRSVTVEMIIGMGLRFLAGGMVRDIRWIYHVSVAETYHSIECFIKCVQQTKELDINLPATPAEWETVRKGFSNRSTNGIMSGCVGALDGYLQRINAPWRREVGNVKSYYSGHYESFGINCQAACDIRLKFLFFGVVAPGKTNDNAAFPLCKDLVKAIKNLPVGTYFVGDAAYSLAENLLVPFIGSQKLNPDNDAFNFYRSQMRIRIEMAFGRIVRKFQVLKRNIEGKLSKISSIVMACARLHNYIIDMDVPPTVINDDEDDNIIAVPHAPDGMGYTPVMLDPNEDFVKVDGVSQARAAIVSEISREGLRRPDYNLERNQSRLVHEERPQEMLEYYHPN